jgi:uncharacterized PurR-regulated membrane protein YhhQ (DUF165 family)
VLICLVFFLPMYGVLLNMLLKRLAHSGHDARFPLSSH